MQNRHVTVGFWGSFPVHFRRAGRIDMDPGELLPDERQAIEAEGVHGGNQALLKLLLWRRAFLYVGFFFLVPTVAIGLIDQIIVMNDSPGLGALAGLQFAAVLCNIALCVGLLIALKRWRDWHASRKVLFWTWLVAFVAPFLVALYPVRALAAQGTLQQQLGLGLVGALSLMLTLAPKAVALIPGVLRAAVTAKILFPWSTAPGWLVAILAPFYILLVFIIMAMPYQISGSPFMAVAMLAFIAAPVFLWRASRELATPLPAEEALKSVKKTRTITAILNAVGGVFLMVGLVDLLGQLDINVLTALKLLFGIVANVILLSVVAVDVIKVALTRMHDNETTPEFRQSADTRQAEMAAFIEASKPAPKGPTPPHTSDAPKA